MLQRILTAAEAGHRDGNGIEALVLLALAHEAVADTPHALAALEKALTRAQVEGFVRIFVDAGAPMKALLKISVRHGQAADQAAAVLSADASTPIRPQQGLVDELSSRELRSRRSGHAGRPPKITTRLTT